MLRLAPLAAPSVASVQGAIESTRSKLQSISECASRLRPDQLAQLADVIRELETCADLARAEIKP